MNYNLSSRDLLSYVIPGAVAFALGLFLVEIHANPNLLDFFARISPIAGLLGWGIASYLLGHILQSIFSSGYAYFAEEKVRWPPRDYLQTDKELTPEVRNEVRRRLQRDFSLDVTKLDGADAHLASQTGYLAFELAKSRTRHEHGDSDSIRYGVSWSMYGSFLVLTQVLAIVGILGVMREILDYLAPSSVDILKASTFSWVSVILWLLISGLAFWGLRPFLLRRFHGFLEQYTKAVYLDYLALEKANQ